MCTSRGAKSSLSVAWFKNTSSSARGALNHKPRCELRLRGEERKERRGWK